MTTAIVGLVGVIVGSVLTALLNFYLQRAADQRRWKREDELQRQHWEREDRAALRAERISLYRDYLAKVYRVVNMIEFDENELRLMMYQIELLGSSEVSRHGVPLFFEASEVWHESDKPPPESKIDEALNNIHDTLYDFNKAVRAELGIPDPPPSPLPPPRIEGKDVPWPFS